MYLPSDRIGPAIFLWSSQVESGCVHCLRDQRQGALAMRILVAMTESAGDPSGEFVDPVDSGRAVIECLRPAVRSSSAASMFSTDRESASLGDSIIQYWVMLLMGAACLTHSRVPLKTTMLTAAGTACPILGPGRANQPAR